VVLHALDKEIQVVIVFVMVLEDLVQQAVGVLVKVDIMANRVQDVLVEVVMGVCG
jgi:hypothetical protein